MVKSVQLSQLRGLILIGHLKTSSRASNQRR
jgi:hypothetical protein